MGKQCRALMLVVPSAVDEYIQRTYLFTQTVKTKVSYRYRNKNDIDIAKTNGYNDGKNLVGQRLIEGERNV